jgi:hypothetical protein
MANSRCLTPSGVESGQKEFGIKFESLEAGQKELSVGQKKFTTGQKE